MHRATRGSGCQLAGSRCPAQRRKTRPSRWPSSTTKTCTAPSPQPDWPPSDSVAPPRRWQDLLKGAFRNYPALKKSTDKFEYGFRLKEFPEDPVKLATKEKTETTTNPLMQWCAKHRCGDLKL